MTIFTNVTIESTDVTFLRSFIDTSWAAAAAGPADITTTNGTGYTQNVTDDAEGAGAETIEEAAFSFDTSGLETTYGAAMEVTAASFKYEIMSQSPSNYGGIVGYYNHYTSLALSDWVNPPPSETTAFSRLLFSSGVGIQTDALSSISTQINTTSVTGIIIVSSGISNNVAPANDKDLTIATDGHATGFVPSLILTIDDHIIPAAATLWLGTSF